ncbi:flagellar protein FlaG [Desulfobacter postgatei]|uniref:flagellar protein FlaG n=1 Tax=Desulfobacter postgatei TaxID=2293 RepID=UPI00259BBD49|nr:flagellar protein FlaG [uncultured Desulfobacter sp.]
MKINDINMALKSVEPKLVDPKPMAPPPVEPDTPASEPNKNEAADQSQATAQKEEESPPAEEVKELAETLNEYMDDLQTDLGFFMHEKLNHQVIVEIKNRKTDELIKQIPSEELVMIKEKMAELTGLLFDTSI